MRGNLNWRSFVRRVFEAVGLELSKSSSEYGVNWSRQRERCLERDSYTCKVCGIHQADLKGEMEVHRIKPRSEFDDQNLWVVNALENLVTLCPTCFGHFEGDFQDSSPEEFVEKARAEHPRMN